MLWLTGPELLLGPTDAVQLAGADNKRVYEFGWCDTLPASRQFCSLMLIGNINERWPL
jgi:hypothetical protein